MVCLLVCLYDYYSSPVKSRVRVSLGFDLQRQTAPPDDTHTAAFRQRPIRSLGLGPPELSVYADVDSGPQWRHYVSLGTDQVFRARADIPLIGAPQHRIEENVLEYPCADESSEGPSRQAEFGTEDKKESPQEEPTRDLEDQVLEKRSAGPDVREYLHCSVEEKCKGLILGIIYQTNKIRLHPTLLF